jgi:hypothetical protein
MEHTATPTFPVPMSDALALLAQAASGVAPVVAFPASTVSPSTPKRRAVHFGKRLGEILKQNQFPDIMRFSPDGTAIWILNRDELGKQIMPDLGMKPNWNSFVRQLRYYGFQYAAKVRSTKFVDVYVHATFNRDSQDVPLRIYAGEPVKSPTAQRLASAKKAAPGIRPPLLEI